MMAKGTKWAEQLQTQPLQCQDAWMSFFYQLMPEITWGLATVTMAPDKMNEEIQLLYFNTLGLLGVNRHIMKEWILLPKKYHGLGLPNFALLALVANIHVLQCHIAFKDELGEMMRQAYKAFVVEVGAYSNILSLNFRIYGALSTK